VSDPSILIVVPTLGKRPQLLDACLASIAHQSVPATIVLIGPMGEESVVRMAENYDTLIADDPGSLAKAINLGMSYANAYHRYVNWLGDDDLLEPDSLLITSRALDKDAHAVLAYGACRYIDDTGKELWVSQAGKWAPRILKWGPDLIPQPGMLVRKTVWDQVGGVDENFRFAFDLDLLLKLQREGSFIDVQFVVSSFRWHGGSLTVSDRTESLRESELARRRSLSPVARRVAWLWERPVRIATRLAASEITRRANSRQKHMP
jgi:GT2 family glycosyltransferase